MGLVYTVSGRAQLGHLGPWGSHSARETNEREQGVQARATRCRGLEMSLYLV